MRVVDAAFADGRISATDRAFRVSQVEAASSRGDLAMVTRDLVGSAPAPAARGQQHAGAHQPAAPQRPPGSPDWSAPVLPPPRPGAGSTVLKVVLIFGFVMASVCAVGLFAVFFSVSSVVDSIDDVPTIESTPSSLTPASPDLFTPTGWSWLLETVEEETGDSLVHYAALREGSGSVQAVADGSLVTIGLGAGTASVTESTQSVPPNATPVDLREMDADMLRGLRQRAARDAGISTPDLSRSRVTIYALGPEPVLLVGVVAEDGRTESLRYDLDGEPAG